MLKKKAGPSMVVSPAAKQLEPIVEQTVVMPSVEDTPAAEAHKISYRTEMKELEAGLENLKKHKEDLQREIETISADIDDAKSKIQKLLKIKAMTKLKNPPYDWQMHKRAASEYNKSKWAEEYEFRMALYTFEITLLEFSEAADGLKFMLTVSVKRTKTGPDTWAGEIDYDFGWNKYMEKQYDEQRHTINWIPSKEKGSVNMFPKFKTEDEARSALIWWQSKLEQDFSIDLFVEKKLFEQCLM